MIHLDPRQVAVVQMLRDRPLAPIPRDLCSGYSVGQLRENGLIERSPMMGFWQITQQGREADLQAMLAAASNSAYKPRGPEYPPEPLGNARSSLLEAWHKLNSLKPGMAIFGAEVRAATMEYLGGLSKERKFIYFAYPVGFPMKHIAWAVREARPLWTEHSVNIERKKVGLPATRFSTRWADKRLEREREAAIRQQLLDDGCTEEEVREYFAIKSVGQLL